MLKIAYIIDTIETPTAGTEKQLLLLIKHLDRSRFTPYLCVLRSSRWLREEFHDCRLIEIGVPSFASIASYKNIWKYIDFLKNNGIDIVQTHFVEGNKVGVLAAKCAGVEVVISTRRNQGYWHNRFEKAWLKVLNRWVTLFLANSYSTSQWAEKAEGISADRINVIHNGIELRQFVGRVEDRDAMRSQLGFSATIPVIGIVANLRPVKGVEVFLRAAKNVIARFPATQFLVVGEGGERQNLLELSRNLGIEDNVRFLGRRQNIPGLLAALDIGVLSSHSESFSNAIVEYMAAGLPVVCTDVGGAREAITEGVNGFVVPPGDHMAMAQRLSEILYGSRSSLMGRESKKLAEKLFSISSVIDQYQNLYERTAGSI
jgi:glycosyltransferase involved in cell wall biosynthesis